MTSPSKNSKFRGADGADACGMAKYIERTKRDTIELRYVSENGSASPDFRIYGEIEEVGEPHFYPL